MPGRRAFPVLLALTMLLLIAASCNQEPSQEPPPNPTASIDSPTEGEADEIDAAMAELAPADRTLAEAQRMCPVSDQPLGSMGAPIKVSVQGRDVFVCCEGCVEELQDNFAKYASKLNQPAS